MQKHFQHTNIMRMHFVGRQPFFITIALLIASIFLITTDVDFYNNATTWQDLGWATVCCLLLLALSQSKGVKNPLELAYRHKHLLNISTKNITGLLLTSLIFISNLGLWITGYERNLTAILWLMSICTMLSLLNLQSRRNTAWALLLCLPTAAGIAASQHWAISTSIVSMLLMSWIPLVHCTRLLYEGNVPCNFSDTESNSTHSSINLKIATMAYAACTACSSLLAFAIDMTGLVFLIATSLLNIRLLYLSGRLLFSAGRRGSLPLHRYAWFYLIAITIIIILDHVWAYCV